MGLRDRYDFDSLVNEAERLVLAQLEEQLDRLGARDGLLFALARDSTVAVWDEARGESLAEISLFADGEWGFVFPGGRYAASAGGAGHVHVSVDGVPADEPGACRIQ
jgi:hypothetical protein